MLNRKCKKCYGIKPINAFNKTYDNYHRYECIDCEGKRHKKYRENNKFKIKDRMKKYYLDNREYLLKRQCKRHIKNRDKRLLYNKKYYMANREKMIQYKKDWDIINPNYAKDYQTNNLDIFRIHASNRRAKIAKSEGHFTKTDIDLLFIKQKNKCIYCNTSIKNNYNIDHIIPIALNGNNDISNIQLTCPKCNSLKSARAPNEFVQTEFGRLF